MTRSDTIGKLAEALAHAQSEIQPASKDKTNPHFKARYADLAAIRDACRDALAKHGLAVLQPVSADGAKVTITTILTHESGEWIAEALTLTAQTPTPQGVGSAITYGRRYGLAAMVGVAPDDDDDGEAASRPGGYVDRVVIPTAREAGVDYTDLRPRPRPPVTPPEQKAIESGHGDTLKISDAQRKRLWAIAKGKGWSDEGIKEFIECEFGYTSTKDILRSQYDEIVKTIEGAP